MRKQKMRTAGTIMAAIAALAMSAGVQAQDGTKEQYRAVGVNMGGGPTGAKTNLLITITRWSTNEERTMLLNTLKEKGHDEFIKALRKQEEAGFIRGTGAAAMSSPFPSTRIQGAWQVERDGNLDIVLVAARNISGAEVAAGARSVDYDTTAIMIQFPGGNKEATGTGIVNAALKLRYDDEKKKLDVEKLGSGSLRLTQVNKQN